MDQRDIQHLHALSELANCNPFSPRRFELERSLLGRQFVDEDAISWNRRHDFQPGDRANVIALSQLATEVVARIQQNQRVKNQPLDLELQQSYWDVVAYVLLYRYITPTIYQTFESANAKSQSVVQNAWHEFYADYQTMLDVGGVFPLTKLAGAHLFACLFQVHRAFWLIFDHLLGDSLPIARLREKVWESVFSCDLARYHDGLYSHLRDLATLITGPSGTGKELVARAIGLAQYMPFDLETESFKPEANRFMPLNLSALAPNLIESELFGHHRGSFTGAVADRVGWLEACSPQGAVFLDEIGELDGNLQVKLLRVLQERVYCRLGESQSRKFRGKMIAATNRNLEDEIRAGRFREDFYFRICCDRIETPSLREQLADRPADLSMLVLAIAKKLTGASANPKSARRSRELADEACEWIEKHLGTSYPWLGNIRELEQCVSSFMLRRTYVPLSVSDLGSLPATHAWAEPILNGTATADELLRRYCASVYARNGSYEQTAQILGIDRRTVKAKLD